MKKLMLTVFASLASAGAVAQTADGAKYMRFTMGSDPMAQVTFATPELCRAYEVATQKQVADGAPMNGVMLACSATSVASMLAYEAVVRDEQYGFPVILSAKTELLCLNSMSEFLKMKDPKFGRSLFTAVAACKLKS